jgi:hypothetical protein
MCDSIYKIESAQKNMIKEKTVFILGAGAGVPYGYPTGEGLRKYIRSDFTSRFKDLCNHLISASSRNIWLDKVEKFTKSFNDSSNLSIDLFLARNVEYLDIWKLGTATVKRG